MTREQETKEYQKQNLQYQFPYHHIPHMDSWRGHSFPSMDRYLWFGFEYLGYNQYIVKKVLDRKPEKVLDVGCGDGKFLKMLNEAAYNKKVNINMAGIDISLEAINLANCLNGGVSYRAMDISDVTESYDCITCIETLEHIPDNNVSQVIYHIHRCLKLGGVAIICVPTTNRPKEDKHFRHYDLEVMERELSDSGVEFKKRKVEYFWRVNALEKYLKATSNRFLYIRFRLLDNLLWKHSFKADAHNGSHLIMTLIK